MRNNTRRAFLAQAGAGLLAGADRLIIDTHLEVWTLDVRRSLVEARGDLSRASIDLCSAVGLASDEHLNQ